MIKTPQIGLGVYYARALGLISVRLPQCLYIPPYYINPAIHPKNGKQINHKSRKLSNVTRTMTLWQDSIYIAQAGRALSLRAAFLFFCFFKIFSLIISACAFESTCVQSPGALDPRRCNHRQPAVSCTMWVLRTKRQPSERAHVLQITEVTLTTAILSGW